MYTSDTEIIFPMRVAPDLKKLRGPEWDLLVDRACDAPECSVEHLAFNLLLVRLNDCLSCRTHSYRAQQGCTYCAVHSVRRYRGKDSELSDMYNVAFEEVSAYQQVTEQISQ